MQKEHDELLQMIERQRAEQARGQQMSRGSVQTVRVSELPLQHSTVIGGGSTQGNQPGLMQHGSHAVYVLPTRLTDKRQVAAPFLDATLKHPYVQLGPHE